MPHAHSPLVSVLVLTYKSVPYLRPLIASIRGQTYTNIELIMIDNASPDDTVAVLKKEFPDVRLIENPENYWFSKGFNIGINAAKGEYIIICNHDIVLEPNFIEEILKGFKDEKIAAVGGKLLKFPGEQMEFSSDLVRLKTLVKSFKIDTTGVQVFRNRRAIDRGESEVDTGQYNVPQEVFGISGALVCFRRSALEAVKFEHEYFDEDIMAYKDDYDMSWRLRHAGYSLWYLPSAIAYHNRRVSRSTDLSDRGTMANRRGKSKIDNIQSYKNHWLVLLKNDSARNFWRDFPFIFWYELKKFVYVLLFEQRTLAAIPLFFRQLARMKMKRKYIFSHSTLRPGEVHHWFVKA
ncbi:MAG: hypothetical protein A3F54_01410 [Candidatus Kerfeldbacteria bacterium RIFCSPHIGHO2_12_FULL_48_17]|uniref:Glycosyltransferase 2-like domain-containing protein n=1 Tax=Candidatus Kerfeldbacteria bacterium RIFCSPHIGHO2_12_FULL_48_17 TaxID=1798542 RepID=A0A1G2AXM7_9BACT|nr:MAG: hypothetical protein A3F54_01410 [Candidatus Kerfeldbacteria bacterium RIFCSPHIGHO2_12_FULL_48_17]